MENLSTTAFARDYHMTGELAADKDGLIKGLRVDPIKFPADLLTSAFLQFSELILLIIKFKAVHYSFLLL